MSRGFRGDTGDLHTRDGMGRLSSEKWERTANWGGGGIKKESKKDLPLNPGRKSPGKVLQWAKKGGKKNKLRDPAQGH